MGENCLKDPAGESQALSKALKILCGTFCGFGQTYNDMYLSL